MKKLLSLFFVTLMTGLPAFADVGLEPFLDGLDEPVQIIPYPLETDRLLVTSIRGKVLWVNDDENGVLVKPFLDIEDRVLTTGNGLQAIAFHPAFFSHPYVYALIAERATNHLLVTRYEVSPDDPERLSANSEIVLIRIEKTQKRHFGGDLAFGPDGHLYVATGDDSGVSSDGPLIDPQCAAQSLERYEGKILRLDVVDGGAPGYVVPADNPFIGAGLPEIWAHGLRNPWRMNFDRETGDLWIADVGEEEREEINMEPAGSPGGRNYGWKMMEGTNCFGDTSGCGAVPACNSPALTAPVLEYSHTAGCSVTGGVVYRGSLVPDLYGRYLYGDYCSGTIWSAWQANGEWLTEELPIALPRIVSFDEDLDGEVYLTDISNGNIFQLTDPSLPEAGLIELTMNKRQANERAAQMVVDVRRLGDDDGAVSVRISTQNGTARAGEDFVALSEVVTWEDDEEGDRRVFIDLLDDEAVEPDETFFIHLDDVQGGAVLGARQSAEVIVADDDSPTCIPDDQSLCINEARFRVYAEWRTADGQSGDGNAVAGGENDGSFWFFGPRNPEIFVKVLDGCGINDHYWVFAAGLTDVEVTLRVLDTVRNEEKTYFSPFGSAFQPVTDTEAFATCP